MVNRQKVQTKWENNYQKEKEQEMKHKWEEEFDNTLGNKLAYIGGGGQIHLTKII